MTTLIIFWIFFTATCGNIWVLANEPEINECTKLIVGISNCSTKIHLPDYCGGTQKSEALTCAENTVMEAPTCHNDLARRMLVQFVKTYRNSDEILCQKDMFEAFTTNKKCWSLASYVARHLAFISENLLTDKGCKFMKATVYTLAKMREKHGCYNIMETYIDRIYDKTPCAHVRVPEPTKDDLKEAITVITYAAKCWIFNKDMPLCGDEKSKRAECMENMNATDIKNVHLKHVAMSLVEVTHQTDHVICRDKQLYYDFFNTTKCWTQVKLVSWLVARKANGLYTAEGCESLKYEENYIISSFDKECIPLLMEYRKAMDELVPCVERPSEAHGHATITFHNTSMLNMLVFIIGTHLILLLLKL